MCGMPEHLCICKPVRINDNQQDANEYGAFRNGVGGKFFCHTKTLVARRNRKYSGYIRDTSSDRGQFLDGKATVP